MRSKRTATTKRGLAGLVAALALQPMLAGPGAGLAAAEGGDPNIAATLADQVRELLSEGMRLAQIGRFDEAALRFKDALLLNPEDRLAYEFMLAAGEASLNRLYERAELQDVLREILRKGRIYQKQLRRDPRYIDLLISKLRADERSRVAATLELVAIGPIAVPQLIEKIGDNKQEDYRVWCRMVLTRMGYRAVIPLCEALNTADERQLQSVALILADIADPRALPRLQFLVESKTSTDTTQRACRNSIAAIAAKSGLSTIPDARTLFFQEAQRYFRDGDQVRDELIANEALMWRWVEDAPANQFKLQYQISPGYAWNELMAEELCYDAATANPDNEGIYPLLASVLSAQDAEVADRVELAKDRTVPSSRTDESLEALQARQAALAEMQDRVALFGAGHLYRGVVQSINSERYDTAIYLMRRLEDLWLARADVMLPSKLEGLMAEKSGTVLSAALEHPEKRIRYQAAITAARLDPKLEFFNAEKVVPLLSDAVGEWGMIAVLVIEPDPRHRNTARHQLQGQGMHAYAANDGFQARQFLGQAPFKDAIIISGMIKPALRDEHGVVIDVDEQTVEGLVKAFKADQQTSQVPIFIALPDQAELASQMQTVFEKIEGIAGFVTQPYNGTELKGKIEKALGDAELPEVNRRMREDVSLRACQALGSLDAARSQFPHAEAADALASTIANRADDIRIAALNALGQTGVAAKINLVTEVYEAQAETLAGKPEVRAAFLRCIGLLDAKTPAAKAILLEAMKAPELLVRRAAQEALGHDWQVTSPDRLDALRQQRLDARTAGNGEAGSAPAPAPAAEAPAEAN